MWILFAFGSALFAGLTAILAKCGIRNTDSNVATALRTGVVLVFSWLMLFMVGAQSEIRDISAKVLIFLILSVHVLCHMQLHLLLQSHYHR